MSWSQQGVIYHVYPRSFADANGDGVGDLRGVWSRLNHLAKAALSPAVLSSIRPEGLIASPAGR